MGQEESFVFYLKDCLKFHDSLFPVKVSGGWMLLGIKSWSIYKI